jgi:hypothetical protein|tara:strand:- start:675 stop:917 length:243 start_codon:yes stop_codon:yes gene_type:complete
MTEQTEEDWEQEKYQAWSKFNNLRSLTTSDMYVSDEDENVVALIMGEKLFLNADFIESLHGRYNHTSEEKSDDDDDLEAA